MWISSNLAECTQHTQGCDFPIKTLTRGSPMSRKCWPILLVLSLSLAGCAATYRPPTTNLDKSAYSKTVDMPFDQTWQKLIEYAAGTFFAIESYEKESGLMTLSFSSSQPSQFIDGGYWKFSNLTASFDGNYVDYLAQYHGGKLEGKMNIVLIRASDAQTRVTVNARYVYSCPPNTWAFDSGGSATISVVGKTAGTADTRTLVPTHFAEQSVLKALEAK